MHAPRKGTGASRSGTSAGSVLLPEQAAPCPSSHSNRPCTAITPSNASRLPVLPSTAAALLDAFFCTCTHARAKQSAQEALSSRALAARRCEQYDSASVHCPGEICKTAITRLQNIHGSFFSNLHPIDLQCSAGIFQMHALRTSAGAQCSEPCLANGAQLGLHALVAHCGAAPIQIRRQRRAEAQSFLAAQALPQAGAAAAEQRVQSQPPGCARAAEERHVRPLAPLPGGRQNVSDRLDIGQQSLSWNSPQKGQSRALFCCPFTALGSMHHTECMAAFIILSQLP